VQARRDVPVVGDHHDRGPAVVQIAQQFQHIRPRHGIEVAGRLVGEQQLRIANHGTGDRHPLPLAAGQLIGAVGQAVPHPHLLQGLCGPPPPFAQRDATVEQPVGHVVQHRNADREMELLEDETDDAGPQRGELTVGQAGQLQSGYRH
jgi:hypothetical protein